MGVVKVLLLTRLDWGSDCHKHNCFLLLLLTYTGLK